MRIWNGLLRGFMLAVVGLAVSGSALAGQRYALMLYEDASYQSPDEADMGARVAEYTAWIKSRAGAVGGEKLADRGYVLSGGSASAGAPKSEWGNLVGYFMIEANDDEAAKAIAATCPHLKYGGRIALRPIESGASDASSEAPANGA